MSSVSNQVTVRSVSAQSRLMFLLIVFVSAIPAFLEGFDTNLYAFASPFVLQTMPGATAAVLGEVGTGYALGIAAFSMVGGFLFDRFSVKYTVMISVVVFAVFTVWTGFVNTTTELFWARLLVGVGIGVFQPAIVALLGDIFLETRGRAVSAFAVFFGGGLFAGPYLISPFLPHYRIPFIISGVAALATLVLFFLIVPKTYKTIEKRTLKFSGIFSRNVMILSLAIFLFGIALFGYVGYFSDYLIQGLHLSSHAAAGVASMGGLGGLICAFPLGYLADRINRRHVTSFAALLIMIGSFGMFSVGSQIALLTLFAFSFGAGWGIFVDLIAAIGQDSSDDALAGTVTGWLFLVFNLGAILGGPLFAVLLPQGFFVAGMVTLGVSSALSFVLTLMTRPTPAM